MEYRYYSTQRPVSAWTYPKPEDNPPMLIHKFNERKYVAEIGGLAWGYIEYDKPLENADIDSYGLMPAAYFSGKVRDMAAGYRRLKRDVLAPGRKCLFRIK